MKRQSSLLVALAERLELRLNPRQQGGERTAGMVRERAVFLVQFCTQGASWAAAPGEHVSIVDRRLDERTQPPLGRLRALPDQSLTLKRRQLLGDDRIADLGLGFEIVVDIAERHCRFTSDIGQRRVGESSLVNELGGRLDQSGSFVS